MALSENSVPSKACCIRGYDSRYVSEVCLGGMFRGMFRPPLLIRRYVSEVWFAGMIRGHDSGYDSRKCNMHVIINFVYAISGNTHIVPINQGPLFPLLRITQKMKFWGGRPNVWWFLSKTHFFSIDLWTMHSRFKGYVIIFCYHLSVYPSFGCLSCYAATVLHMERISEEILTRKLMISHSHRLNGTWRKNYQIIWVVVGISMLNTSYTLTQKSHPQGHKTPVFLGSSCLV